MKLPHPLIESCLFQFDSPDELISALGSDVSPQEIDEICTLVEKGLPPAISPTVLAVLLGVNPGIVWSFEHRTRKHYRRFQIPKGRGFREIAAPRIGLKIIQKWLSFHVAKFVELPGHVFGFVPGRNHVQAAIQHRNAKWAYSIDIANFFPSTPKRLVTGAYELLGYNPNAAEMLAALSCLDGFLAQGAPTSPVLSNICLTGIDNDLKAIAERRQLTLTRYADDIVFSGPTEIPGDLREELRALFDASPWQIAPAKELLQPIKGRIKIHGLLVQNGRVRLTKGYRNRLRAYRHLIAAGKPDLADADVMMGHINYSNSVDSIIQTFETEGS